MNNVIIRKNFLILVQYMYNALNNLFEHWKKTNIV